MNEYPDWVEVLRYIGLDPVTVWIEYRTALYASLVLLAVGLVGGIYALSIRLRGFITNYKHSFADRTSFHRSVFELEEKYHEPLLTALNNEPLATLSPPLPPPTSLAFTNPSATSYSPKPA